MIVASLTTQDVIQIVLEAPNKALATRIVATRYYTNHSNAKRLVDAVACQLMALDYMVSQSI